MQGISSTAGPTAFRIRRPLITTNGFVTDLDPRVKEQLDTLEQLLGARVFSAPDMEALELRAEEKNGSAGTVDVPLDPELALALPLTPQRSRGATKWQARSLAAVLDAAQEEAADDLVTLAEYVDRTPDLSTLRYAVDDALAADWYALDDTRRRVLDDSLPNARTYLVAYAYLVVGLREVGAIKNFLLNDRNGAPRLADYAVIGAARDLVGDKGYNIKGYDLDDSPFVKALRAADIRLTATSFEPAVMAVIDNAIADVDYADIIEAAKAVTGPLSIDTKRLLAKYIEAMDPKVKITKDNIKFFAPIWLSQISNVSTVVDTSTEAPEQADQDFDIDVFQDDDSAIQVSRTAIKCAAQLYYAMVLGDELGVFAVVNHFTHQYLVRGGMEIRDGRLRDDLQAYVFSNRFTDLRTGRLLDRTRPAERRMFQRQVFDLGHAQVPRDLVVNQDFLPLWKTLMLESAHYLERAQASFNPDGFVSRQNVMQAVEDLQYNLSTHCTGMATVATPLIHAELNFVIRRILMHPEVLQQVVPVGGTWWRVVERLYVEMKHARPKATVFYNKAKLGHDIIKAIADYNPSTFESDAEFSSFISTVDAFITTQSILQEALTDDLKRRQEEQPAPPGDRPAGPAAAAPVPVMPDAGAAPGGNGNGKHAADEWDF